MPVACNLEPVLPCCPRRKALIGMKNSGGNIFIERVAAARTEDSSHRACGHFSSTQATIGPNGDGNDFLTFPFLTVPMGAASLPGGTLLAAAVDDPP